MKRNRIPERFPPPRQAFHGPYGQTTPGIARISRLADQVLSAQPLGFILPFVIPVALFAVPALLYAQGRADGSLPATVEWDSSGPWKHSVAIFIVLAFMLGAVVHLLAIGISLYRGQRQLCMVWCIGTACGLVSSFLTLHYFGYLMD